MSKRNVLPPPTTHRFVSLASICVALSISATMWVACSDQSVPTPSVESNQEGITQQDVDAGGPQLLAAGPTTEFDSVSLVVSDEIERTETFAATSSTSNVSGGINGFVALGFKYVDTNSVVFVRNITKTVCKSTPIQQFSLQSSAAEEDCTTTLQHSDTIVWLAFENPTNDMANHSAIVTAWRDDGPKTTVRIQLDVSTELLAVLEEGYIIDGDFSPEDVGTTDFVSCMAEALTVGTAGCLWFNCAWAKCMGAVATVALVGCGWQALFGE